MIPNPIVSQMFSQGWWVYPGALGSTWVQRSQRRWCTLCWWHLQMSGAGFDCHHGWAIETRDANCLWMSSEVHTSKALFPWWVLNAQVGHSHKFPFIRTPVLGLGLLHDLPLTNCMAKTYFQIKSHSQVPDEHEWGRELQFNPVQV